MLNFFPTTSLADVFIFGGVYYGGTSSYFLPIPEEGGAPPARRRYIFIN